MAMRIAVMFVLAPLLAASCGDTETPDASSYAAGEEDAADVNAGEAETDGDGSEDRTAEAPEDEPSGG